MAHIPWKIRMQKILDAAEPKPCFVHPGPPLSAACPKCRAQSVRATIPAMLAAGCNDAAREAEAIAAALEDCGW